jgi:phosphate/sulfate permease
LFLELLILASALYLGFNIGSNDAANCVGACVGGGALSMRTAVGIAAVFAVLGGVIGGSGVAKTVAQGVVPAEELTMPIAIICLLASGLMVTLATFRGIPVSSSHAIVLSIVGAALAAGGGIRSAELGRLALAWILLPIAMIPLSYATFWILDHALSRVTSLIRLELTLKYMLILSGVYASFALGANHAGLAGGLLEGVGLVGRFGGMLLGSLAIGAGVVFLSRRVIGTVGLEITALGPTSAFAMQFSAAVGLTVCSILGIPISSSQTIVFAAVGVGLVHGVGGVDLGRVGRIALYWVAVPLVSTTVAFVIVSILGG